MRAYLCVVGRGRGGICNIKSEFRGRVFCENKDMTLSLSFINFV